MHCLHPFPTASVPLVSSLEVGGHPSVLSRLSPCVHQCSRVNYNYLTGSLPAALKFRFFEDKTITDEKDLGLEPNSIYGGVYWERYAVSSCESVLFTHSSTSTMAPLLLCTIQVDSVHAESLSRLSISGGLRGPCGCWAMRALPCRLLLFGQSIASQGVSCRHIPQRARGEQCGRMPSLPSWGVLRGCLDRPAGLPGRNILA